MSIADEADRARTFLAMAEGVAKKQGRELTPAEFAAVGQGYAMLAVMEAILNQTSILTMAIHSVDREVTAIRAAVEN